MLLIKSLQNPALFDHQVLKFEVIETHISWVLLTGHYAYKIKKPVNFGFLDFSTLELRHFYCNEELRLNHRLAPALYLDVVSIHGSTNSPEINAQGPIIEYAVKMKQFPQSVQLDHYLKRHGLDHFIMDKLAEKIAEFHLSIEKVSPDSYFGDLEHVKQPVLENFKHIRDSISEQQITQQLDKLELWSKNHLDKLSVLIQQRKMQGFVRECHGDMHLRNIALWKNEIVIFDCIEFNKNFYWIDVMSEIAFLIMDLEDRQQDVFAWRFLNSYLEITGDYEGLVLLSFYKVYRALVRAKVDALRLGQESSSNRTYKQTFKDFLQYLNLAETYTRVSYPCLLINFGFSGSGKSVGTKLLLEKYRAIQVRSDVERKRLFQADAKSATTTVVEQGIYTVEATQKTYTRLSDIAHTLITSGYSVIIDAANLKSYQRKMFIELAGALNIPCVILSYSASAQTLNERVIQRALSGDDVSDATPDILQHQIKNHDPLTEKEKQITVEIDTEKTIDADKIIEFIQHQINE